ncbi:F-box protein CPR1 [Linum grandiflorum]
MSDLIPQEIMANILLRLRVKDLVICRRVSKQWLLIIDDPHFIGSQLRQSLSTNSNSAVFIHDISTSSLLKFTVHKSCTNSQNIIGNIFSESPAPAGILVGSCHGLVCFCLPEYPPGFVIANPSTGERHKLSYDLTEGDMRAYGFGYDEFSEDYKVVRILRTMYEHPYVAEIYSVRSKGFFMKIPLPDANWRKKNFCKSMGVFFGSSLHWCMWNTTDLEHVVHAIDLVSNTYDVMQLPQTAFGGSWCLKAGVVDRRLCLVGFFRNERDISIWVMEEYGNSESWNRIYRIHDDDRAGIPFVGSDGDKILLMFNGPKFLRYDPTKKKAYHLTTTIVGTELQPCTSDQAVFYLESLVKIFPTNFAEKKLADDRISQISFPTNSFLMNGIYMVAITRLVFAMISIFR